MTRLDQLTPGRCPYNLDTACDGRQQAIRDVYAHVADRATITGWDTAGAARQAAYADIRDRLEKALRGQP